MNKTLNFLRNHKNNPQIEVHTELIQSGLLDSYDIMSLINHLEEVFKIEIIGEDIIPENFTNIQKILSMVKRNGGKDQ